MSEKETKSNSSETSVATTKIRSRRKLFLRRTLFGVIGGSILLFTIFYFWISSDSFQQIVRHRIIEALETATGGHVEIASFHWKPLHLEADVHGLVLHGLEKADEAPYAQIEDLHIKVSLFGLWSPRILLRSLEVTKPQFHFIVYSDGTTNQPHPKIVAHKSTWDTFFDLQAGQINIQQGAAHIENLTEESPLNRTVPLDFNAQDVSVKISYAAATNERPESYNLNLGASDLNLVRGKEHSTHARIEAILNLTRSAAYLRSMSVVSEGSSKHEMHTLNITGQLEDFNHPHWQVHTSGELDMQLIYPSTGYPSTPEGIAHIELDGYGQPGDLHTDGTIHVDNGAYISSNVNEHGITLDAHVHADSKQLLISSITARLHQGGQLEGSVELKHWLAQSTDKDTIPVNGRVTAKLVNVSLDTVLDIVSKPPYQKLGLNALLNGPASASWSNGNVDKSLTVNAKLGMTSGMQITGEIGTSGQIDATYMDRNGSVDVRQFDLYTPASSISANGQLGAYPITSNMNLAVNFHSSNLSEFDTVLQKLGLRNNGKTGTAALPVNLTGKADFSGAWTGSLARPHIAGDLKATQLAIELPSVATEKFGTDQSTQPRWINWDEVNANGSYSDEKIVIENGIMRRGNAEISLNGSLASSRPASTTTFDSDSLLQLHVRANRVNSDDLLPLVGPNFPIQGQLNAQLQISGYVREPHGSGWVELVDGKIYGQQVAHLRAEGTIEQNVLKITSIHANEASGKITATGRLDLNSRQFQVDANGTGIDVTHLTWLQQQAQTSGKLAFSINGTGTIQNPALNVHATINNLSLNSGPFGTIEINANTLNHAATYSATARLESTELTLHGQTNLDKDYTTQANLNFSRYNIGAVLKTMHIKGLEGESAMAGTVTLSGPLAHPDEFQGEARLKEVAMTVAGVHLKSDGEAHATLSNSRIHIDPLHVVGEDTDLRAEGSLVLKGNRQLDLSANGSVNLKLAQTIDSDITASGTTTFQVDAHGPLSNPSMRGRIEIQNGALSLEDVPNGLSQLHGTFEFNQNRLEVRSLTATSGGGQLNFSGYLAYQRGLYADLSVTGKDIRIRYPQGVSSMADAALHLQGTQTNMLLSGNMLITRFTISPDLDIAALASQTNNIPFIAPSDAPSNHVRLDVHVTSSQQLNFKNAYAKLAGDVDLRLRGTMATPSLLGKISVTEGSATLAGTRYDLQRGDITFTNPVRIEPIINISATARVEDYDITLALHGTLDKLAVSYRSDPPLPEADVVALLALGRTENQRRLYTQQQEKALSNPATDALLGGALNATVSNRVQKLFGAGSVKVDPNYIGALGNSTSRIIVEEQVGRVLTLTYATNVNTTSQQLIQAEVAINRHVSLLVARDESGVFSMVIKATRRYK